MKRFLFFIGLILITCSAKSQLIVYYNETQHIQQNILFENLAENIAYIVYVTVVAAILFCEIHTEFFNNNFKRENK